MVLNFAKPHLNLEGQILADREVRPARYGPTVGVLLFWWGLGDFKGLRHAYGSLHLGRGISFTVRA